VELAVARQALSALSVRPGAFARVDSVARTHSDPRLRRAAVSHLVQRDALAAFPTLALLARDDPSSEVRKRAIAALGHAPESLAIPVLMELVGAVDMLDTGLRRESVESLSRFSTAQVQDRLNEIAWSDGDARLRTEAIDGLARQDNVRANRLLLEIARKHPNRQTSAAALHRLQRELF
jgi:HEAT repeat protein